MNFETIANTLKQQTKTKDIRMDSVIIYVIFNPPLSNVYVK